MVVNHYRMGELDIKLQRFESAIAHFEAGIAVLDGMIAKRLNETTAVQEKELVESRLEFCQLAPLATGNWSALIGVDPKQLPALLSLRATELAKRGRITDVAQAGAKLRELTPKSSNNLYNAACAYGLSAVLAVKSKPTPTPAEEADRKRFVDLALACLKEAIGAGFQNFGYMKQDTDLAALRVCPNSNACVPNRPGNDRAIGRSNEDKNIRMRNAHARSPSDELANRQSFPR